MEGGLVSSIGNKRGRDDEDKDDKEGNIGRLEKRPSGMVQIIDQDQYEYRGDEMINGVKYEEEKTPTPTSGGGGLFNQFITNLVNNSPGSNNHQQGSDFFEGELEKNGGGEGEPGTGVITNFISNVFSSNGNGNGNNGDGVVVEKDGGEAVENGGDNQKDGGGDIIDTIVAKLPRTLSEDTAPATDEASILIHSIIHD